MKIELAQVAFAISLFFSNVFAITIKQNTLKSGNLDPVDDITIAPGAYYLIVNNALTTLLGTFDNQGKFYVTGENDFTCSVSATGSSFENSGELDFDSSKAEAVATYNIATTGTFSNSGVMYLGVSGGPLFDAAFTVTSEDSWTNTGTMVFQRSSGPAAPLVIGQVNFDQSSITNKGSICMLDVTWAPNTHITGRGCISLGAGSSLELNAEVYPFDDTQIINLDAPNSKLSIVGLALYLLDLPTYKVSGFGNGNIIEIDLDLTSYTYDSTSGILSLGVSSWYDLQFDIGYGYSPELFSTNADALAGSTISYNRPPPNKAPAVCHCNKKFPHIPTTTFSSSSIVSSSTLGLSTPSLSYALQPSSSVSATNFAVPSVSGSSSSDMAPEGNGKGSLMKTSGGSRSASSATSPGGSSHGSVNKTSGGSRSASSTTTPNGNGSASMNKTSGVSRSGSSATTPGGNGSDSVNKSSGRDRSVSSSTTPGGIDSDSMNKHSGENCSGSSSTAPGGIGSDSINKTSGANGEISSNIHPVSNGSGEYDSGTSNTTLGGNSSSSNTTPRENNSDSQTVPKGQNSNSSNTAAGSQGSNANGRGSSSTALGDQHGSGEHDSGSSMTAPGVENYGSNIPASASHIESSTTPLSITLSSIPSASTPNSNTVSIEFSSAARFKMSIVMMMLSFISFSI